MMMCVYVRVCACECVCMSVYMCVYVFFCVNTLYGYLKSCNVINVNK